MKNKYNISSIGSGFKGYDSQHEVFINNNNNLDDIKAEVLNLKKNLQDKTLYTILPVAVYKNEYGSFVSGPLDLNISSTKVVKLSPFDLTSLNVFLSDNFVLIIFNELYSNSVTSCPLSFTEFKIISPN